MTLIVCVGACIRFPRGCVGCELRCWPVEGFLMCHIVPFDGRLMHVDKGIVGCVRHLSCLLAR